MLEGWNLDFCDMLQEIENGSTYWLWKETNKNSPYKIESEKESNYC